MEGAPVQIVIAAGNLIAIESGAFRYNLAEILNQTYGNQIYKSALVFGKEEHFDKTGIEAIVQDYIGLAERLVNSMRGLVLFLTAA